jgi:excisionase family DNA binding protein
MARNYYTTSQAAALLSVSADTVLKWVRAGKIASYRTPGGHARIPSEAVNALLPQAAGDQTPADDETGGRDESPFHYCWDFYAGPDGAARAACEDCVVYRSQARRCYEMRSLPEQFGPLKLFCETSCEECDFYQLTHASATSVLVVSRNKAWREKLLAQAQDRALDLRCAASEYGCGKLIQTFRPDFIVLDSSFGSSRTREFCHHLAADERIPFARVILASQKASWAEKCASEVFAWIKKPFSVDQLTDLVSGITKEI